MGTRSFGRLLVEVGIRMKSTDLAHVFNFFDSNHNGYVSIEEFTKVLALTDYEIDLAVEKIRFKLLFPCLTKESQQRQTISAVSLVAANAARAHIGVIGANSVSTHPDIGKNKIKENIALSNIFQIINVNGDGIMSLDELMDLAAKLEVFLSEEEARKVLTLLDTNGDDRVEESDFIAFMRRDSVSVIKKAFRIREAAAFLRRWLIRGSSEKPDAASSTTASTKQWQEFKIRYERSSGQKFPGYLSAHVLQLTLANLSFRLSSIEARELTLIVAPEKNGRVHLSELHAFMGRSCRSFGELVALLDRDILKDLMDLYRPHMKALKLTGKEDVDLAMMFKKKLDDVKKSVELIYTKLAEAEKPGEEKEDKHDDDEDDETHARNVQSVIVVQDPRFRKSSHEVISIAQLRTGLHDYFNVNALPENLQPNIEEWACLSILVGADIAEGDIYGVRLKAFLEGICKYIYTCQDEAILMSGDKAAFEMVCRELRLQIYYEAKSASKDKKPNYKGAFDLFDADRNGSISTKEFRDRLQKLHLLGPLSDQQVTNMMNLFDRSKRGQITYEDFKVFAEEAEKYIVADEEEDMPGSMRKSRKVKADGTVVFEVDDDDDDDEDDEDEEFGLSSNNPPIVVTRNSDCDWLAWHLYRQACTVEPVDPEGVITELESLCAETEMTQKREYISVKEFWNLLYELRLQGSMSKQQFVKGIQLVCVAGHGGDEDRVDYSSLCKYAIRMGRAYLAKIQEKNRETDKNFAPLLVELKKYFQLLCQEK